MFHFVKKPKWLRRFYGDCIWEIATNEKVIYLTFDDGPHPTETPFVLDQLAKHNAKATFFFIGKNVVEYPEIRQQVVDAGHAIGNHTNTHIDGWKTGNNRYFQDINEAAASIPSTLFRPPFGHITWRQVKKLKRQQKLKTILWSVLSADFDEGTTPERCFENVIRHSGPGSIVLFHDSSLASRNMREALPRVLEYYTEKGYRFEKLEA